MNSRGRLFHFILWDSPELGGDIYHFSMGLRLCDSWFCCVRVTLHICPHSGLLPFPIPRDTILTFTLLELTCILEIDKSIICLSYTYLAGILKCEENTKLSKLTFMNQTVAAYALKCLISKTIIYIYGKAVCIVIWGGESSGGGVHNLKEREVWKNIRHTWTCISWSFIEWVFRLVTRIHKGLTVGLISFIWNSELLFHKDTERNQPKSSRGAMLALNEYTNCFFTVFFNVFLRSCWDLHKNEMSYSTTLPASGTVYFLVFWWSSQI